MTGTTRQNIFKLKRSNISGKIPTTSQLLVGELAVNTQDGFLFTAISDSGGTTTTGVRQIGWDRLSTLSGGTVNGPVTFNSGVTATTFQTTSIKIDGPTTAGYVLTTDANGNGTWQASTGGSSGGTDNYVTGGTFNSTTRNLTLNRTNGSVIITGITDTYVTGFTYNNANILTISQNGLPNLNVTISNMTGLTVNGTLSATTIQGNGTGIRGVGLRTKSGEVTAGTFAGSPRTSNVTFTTNFRTINYSISILGGDNRTFTYESKATSGFTINANSAAALSQPVLWIAIEHGEY